MQNETQFDPEKISISTNNDFYENNASEDVQVYMFDQSD